LRWENIQDEVWTLIPQKSQTGKPVYIPIVPLSREIINRNGYHHPVFVMPRKCLEGKSGVRKMM
jgi:hypothetical protein